MATKASISHLKGLRTRYFNLISRELSESQKLRAEGVDEDNLDGQLRKVSTVKTRLTNFSAKYEEVNEKYICSVSELESKEQEKLLQDQDEILEFISNVTENIADLVVFEGELTYSKQHKVETTPTGLDKHLAKLAEAQNQLQVQTQELLELQKLQLEQLRNSPDSNNISSTSLRLPKLEIPTFNGSLLNWKEFWGSFELAIDRNESLSSAQKLTYLKSKLSGSALSTVSGLCSSNDNYGVAVNLLKERFGDRQCVIDAHYSHLMDLLPSSNSPGKLRIFYDTVEKHLRSLESHGQDVNQQIFVSMIFSKLPRDVILQLEMQKSADEAWTVGNLRKSLKLLIMAREATERHSSQTFENKPKANSRVQTEPKLTPALRSSTEALVATTDSTALSKYHPSSGCRFCGQLHWTDECTVYSTLDSRKQRIKGHCYVCLRKGHSFRDCEFDKACFHCHQRKNHHRSLCPKKLSGNLLVVPEHANVINTDYSQTTKCESTMVATGEVVLMQTATTSIRNPNNSVSHSVRLLLDSGSHRTYVTESLVKRLSLKLEKDSQEISLVTFGSKNPKIIKTSTVKLDIQLKDGQYITLIANVVPQITGALHRGPVDLRNCAHWQYLWKNSALADTLPTETETSSIDMLIGNDYYLDLIIPEKIQLQPGLYLLGSRLGWILSGRLASASEKENEISMLVITFEHPSVSQSKVFCHPDVSLQLKPNLEDFWNLEKIGITDTFTDNDDDRAIQNFNETVTMEDNRYYVTWPWREDSSDLPENKNMAFNRLRSLVHRLKKTPELLEKYHSVIAEQEQRGIIEKVQRNTAGGKKHYIPHHAVLTPGKTTTKVRIVYDASAKVRKEDKSLNQCLYRGPVILKDICGLLLRFRTHPIALISDIEKAFLQVGLQEADRDVTRFFWLKNPACSKVDGNVQMYRFKRVPFGIISSPFLLGATIMFHLRKTATPICEKIGQNLYVDNIITGCDNISSAKFFYQESKDIFKSASMNIREWASNSEEFLKTLPENDVCVKDTMKVLGIVWDLKSDELSLVSPKLQKSPEICTKREVLHTVASVFDPLGIASPIILKGKLLLQDLWRQNTEWDTPLSDENMEQWIKVRESLETIPELVIPRFLGLSLNEHKVSAQLLCFCDASMQAFAAAVYLRLSSGDHCEAHLVFAKTRLAPLKGITLPRLELLAVLTGVRCLNFVKDQLHLQSVKRNLWTDSQCVLHWIASRKPQPVFIENRLKEIRQFRDISFNFVPSIENPADLATRGNFVTKLQAEYWLNGPNWIRETADKWPSWTVPSQEGVSDYPLCELKLPVISQAANPANHPVSPYGINSSKFSSLSKLLRVTAWCTRFITKLRHLSSVTGPLTSRELQLAKRMWEANIQLAHFQSEISCLQQNKKVTNLSRQLGLQLDSEGLLRCHGRFRHADLTQGAKTPKLLPGKHPFTRLTITSCHIQSLHAGVSQTLATLRQEYWVPQGRAVVKSVLKTCTVCLKYEGGPYKMPAMPPLPKERVSQSSPFTHTGLDYLGPLYIKQKPEPVKAWVCLFTCLVTRAVHLEVITDMSAEQFLMCFRRFLARFGRPQRVISDNAPQFKLAKTVLDKAWSGVIRNPDVYNYMATVGIQWQFIVELAPWMGGFYERLVGLVKRSLRKSIGKTLLTYVQLLTFLSEVSAVLNSRPLVYVDDDINSAFTLTPNHFLGRNTNTGAPHLEDDSDPDYLPDITTSDKLLQAWKKGQKHLNRFWQCWRDDYLLSLRERTQTHLKAHRVQSPRQPRVRDVVLVKDNLPRGSWKMGRITEFITSSDGEIRAAKVVLPSKNVVNRPLCLLYPLESQD